MENWRGDKPPPYNQHRNRAISTTSTGSITSTWSDRSLGSAGGFNASAFTRNNSITRETMRRKAVNNLISYNDKLGNSQNNGGIGKNPPWTFQVQQRHWALLHRAITMTNRTPPMNGSVRKKTNKTRKDFLRRWMRSMEVAT